jgi:hypothetical protein
MHNRSMLPKVRARKAVLWKRMEALLTRAALAPAEMQQLLRRRAYLASRIRQNKGDIVAHAEEVQRINDRIEEARKSVVLSPDEQAYMDKLIEEYDALEARLAATSVRRKEGYFPHKFYGGWRLFRVETDPETGNVEEIEITSDQGFFDSVDDALDAARDALERDPNANFIIRKKSITFPNLGGTVVSDRSYGRIITALENALTLPRDVVRQAARQAVRRRSRRRVFQPGMLRTGAEGFSKDMSRVMRTHIAQTVRYVEMDKLKFRYVTTTEAEGLSPHRITSIKQEGRLQLFYALEAWFRDVNGGKQSFEETLDSLIEMAGPMRSAIAAGALAFLAAGGLAGSPAVIAALAAGYVGWRVYHGAKGGGEFATRTIINRFTSDMAHLKLGWLLNLGSATVNMTQTFINTYPVLGERWTAEGFARANAALWSQAIHGDNLEALSHDARLLRRADIATKFRFGQQNPWLSEVQTTAAKVSMFPFETVERLNRATAFLGAYYRALDRGASPAEAMAEGRKIMRRTQFHQGNANKPELLRQIWAALPLQFQNFVFQQIAFFTGLRSPGEIARFALAMFLFAGLLGLAFGSALWDEIIYRLFGVRVTDLITEQAAQWGAPGQFLARGLPGMLGVDISQRVGIGKGFLPESLSDWITGPAFGTIRDLSRRWENDATWVDLLQAITPAAAPLKSLEAAANGAPLFSPAFMRQFGQGETAFTDPNRRNMLRYEPTVPEMILRGVGLRPIRETMEADIQRYRAQDEETRRRLENRYLGRIIRAVREGREEDIEAVLDAAARAGVYFTARRLRDAMRDAYTPQIDRLVRNAPRRARGDLIERIDQMEATTPRPARAPAPAAAPAP